MHRYIPICVHAYTHTCTQTHSTIYLRIYMYTCHSYAHMRIYIYACMHIYTCAQSHIHANECTCNNVHIHINLCMCICMHTIMCAYISAN